MTGAGDLEEHPVLLLERDLLVVEATRHGRESEVGDQVVGDVGIVDAGSIGPPDAVPLVVQVAPAGGRVARNADAYAPSTARWSN